MWQYELILISILETKLRELKEETKNRASIEGIKSGMFIKFGKNQTFYSESKSEDKKFTKPLIVKGKKTDKEVLRSKIAYIENQGAQAINSPYSKMGPQYLRILPIIRSAEQILIDT